ncbi:MAG TPA: fluoride efflux transporter CrcB [Bryobacteraceae bacterium]|jgi:CrcB protein
MLNKILLVMLGGGTGAALRFLVGDYVTRLYGGLFPMGTFLINVTGSFFIGILMTVFVGRPDINPNWRLFLVTGILGGYTTFSSFEWETFATMRSGAPLVALLNVTFSVLLGFLGVWLGFMLVTKVRGQ